MGRLSDTSRRGVLKDFLASGAAHRVQLEQLPFSTPPISTLTRGSLEAPQVCGAKEPLVPEPLRVEGRAAQGQGAFETQKRCHPRLHKAARIRGLGVCAEISNTFHRTVCPFSARHLVITCLAPETRKLTARYA